MERRRRGFLLRGAEGLAMGRACTVCRNASVAEINGELARGVEHTALAERYGVGADAITRHSRVHLPRALARAAEADRVLHGDWLLIQVLQTKADASKMRRRFRAAGLAMAEVAAAREVRESLTLLARLVGELPDTAQLTIGVFQSVEFKRLTTVILSELDSHPEIKDRVAAALLAEADAAEVG